MLSSEGYPNFHAAIDGCPIAEPREGLDGISHDKIISTKELREATRQSCTPHMQTR